MIENGEVPAPQEILGQLLLSEEMVQVIHLSYCHQPPTLNVVMEYAYLELGAGSREQLVPLAELAAARPTSEVKALVRRETTISKTIPVPTGDLIRRTLVSSA